MKQMMASMMKQLEQQQQMINQLSSQLTEEKIRVQSLKTKQILKEWHHLIILQLPMFQQTALKLTVLHKHQTSALRNILKLNVQTITMLIRHTKQNNFSTYVLISALVASNAWNAITMFVEVANL